MAPKTVEGGQIWLKCITGDLIMMIRDKNNIFERVENFHADLAWIYPPPPHYHHQTKASLRPARSRKGTCGARINFRWVHIGHFSKNGLIENTHTFCGKIQEVSLNVWRNTMDSKGQICEKIMFVSICGVGRTQTMASCNGSCSLGRMTPQPKQAQRQREKELIFRKLE